MLYYSCHVDHLVILCRTISDLASVHRWWLDNDRNHFIQVWWMISIPAVWFCRSLVPAALWNLEIPLGEYPAWERLQYDGVVCRTAGRRSSLRLISVSWRLSRFYSVTAVPWRCRTRWELFIVHTITWVGLSLAFVCLSVSLSARYLNNLCISPNLT